MRVAWTNRTSANGGHPLETGEGGAELAAKAFLCFRSSAELVEPEQRRAHDRRGGGRANGRRGSLVAKTRVDRGEQIAVDVLQHPAAEQDLDRLVGELETRQGDARQRDDLGGEP